MAIRKKLNHDDRTREKIQTSQLVNRLTNHILNNAEMSSTQIRAAEILLNKTLPNLASIDSYVETSNQSVKDISDEQLATIATTGSTGATEQASSKKDLH